MGSVTTWPSVDQFRIAPLTCDGVVDLVGRLEYDNEVKERFCHLVKARLYRTHNELVSTPLLCTIMLLTFSDSGHIARSRHEFYDEAYSALWSKHDSRKDGSERNRFTRLSKIEFDKLLSGVAASSYLTSEFEMREKAFFKHLQTATDLYGIACRGDDFLQDSTVSTSLMIHDGPYIRFCHKSFHEYFTAMFVCDSDPEISEPLIEEIAGRSDAEDIFRLLYSMDQGLLEKLWVSKSLSLLHREIAKHGGDHFKYALLCFGDSGAPRGMQNRIRLIGDVYNFRPTSDDLLTAFYAIVDMGQSAAKGASARRFEQMFRADRDNFIRLRQNMKEKSGRKATALSDFIKKASK